MLAFWISAFLVERLGTDIGMDICIVALVFVGLAGLLEARLGLGKED